MHAERGDIISPLFFGKRNNEINIEVL